MNFEISKEDIVQDMQKIVSNILTKKPFDEGVTDRLPRKGSTYVKDLYNYIQNEGVPLLKRSKYRMTEEEMLIEFATGTHGPNCVLDIAPDDEKTAVAFVYGNQYSYTHPQDADFNTPDDVMTPEALKQIDRNVLERHVANGYEGEHPYNADGSDNPLSEDNYVMWCDFPQAMTTEEFRLWARLYPDEEE